MIETRFYEALLSEARCDAGEYRCYGRQLAPFSLRHSLQLVALESPLLAGEPLDELDLVVAVEICATRALCPQPIPGKWGTLWRRARHDFGTERERFLEYFRACYARPRLVERENRGGAVLRAPLELLIATNLLRHTRLSEERVWTMPFGLALWYFEAVKEQEHGDSDLFTEELEADIAAQASAEAVAAADRATRYFVHLGEQITQTARDPRAHEAARTARDHFIASGEIPEDFA